MNSSNHRGNVKVQLIMSWIITFRSSSPFFVQPVGKRCRRWFFDTSQHVLARDGPGILCCLVLTLRYNIVLIGTINDRFHLLGYRVYGDQNENCCHPHPSKPVSKQGHVLLIAFGGLVGVILRHSKLYQKKGDLSWNPVPQCTC